MTTDRLLTWTLLAWLVVAATLAWQMWIADLHPRWLFVADLSGTVQPGSMLSAVSSLIAIAGAVLGRRRMLLVGAAMAAGWGLLAVALSEWVVADPYRFMLAESPLTTVDHALIRTGGLTVLLTGLTGAAIAFVAARVRPTSLTPTAPTSPPAP